MLGRFCPYPDKPIDASDLISFVVKTLVPYFNENKSIGFSLTMFNFVTMFPDLRGTFDLKESVFVAPKDSIFRRLRFSTRLVAQTLGKAGPPTGP